MQGSQAYKSQGNYGNQSIITHKNESDQIRRLKEQNDSLKAELQKLTYGG